MLDGPDGVGEAAHDGLGRVGELVLDDRGGKLELRLRLFARPDGTVEIRFSGPADGEVELVYGL